LPGAAAGNLDSKLKLLERDALQRRVIGGRRTCCFEDGDFECDVSRIADFESDVAISHKIDSIHNAAEI
jgi:hypothetical protein